MTSTFTIASTTKDLPKLKLHPIKTDILGNDYELTLNYIGAKRAQSLNQIYRQKDYVPNVLSFPLDKHCGEIYICPAVAKREAHKFSLSVEGYLVYLFIHGCLHLKGYDHGAKMDELEQHYKQKYRVA